MDKKNRKGGRPKKGAAEKLSYKITVALCTKDYYSLKAKAATAGMCPAEFVRMAIVNSRITPLLTPQEAGWLRELCGMCNNLNQLARQANRSGFAEIKNANITLGREIYNIIKRMRNDGKNH